MLNSIVNMFSIFQKKLIALAISCFCVFVIFLFVVGIFYGFGFLLTKFSTVIWPLVLAIILCVIVSPLVNFMATKLRMGNLWASVVFFVLVILITSLSVILALPIALDEVNALIASLPEAIDKVEAFLSTKFPEFKDVLSQKFGELEQSKELKAFAGNVISSSLLLIKKTLGATSSVISFISYIVAFAVSPIYLFYMLNSNFDYKKNFNEKFSFLSEDLREDLSYFVSRFSQIIITFFRSQLLIAFIMGLIYGTGLALCGVNFGFLLGMICGLLNLVPYLGTMVGLSIILPVAGLQTGGGMYLVAMALCVFCITQMIEGYFLTPKIMGGKTGLHPTVIIFSVFFWGIALNGILGMILAIPLTAFIVASWERISVRIKNFV